MKMLIRAFQDVTSISSWAEQYHEISTSRNTVVLNIIPDGITEEQRTTWNNMVTRIRVSVLLLGVCCLNNISFSKEEEFGAKKKEHCIQKVFPDTMNKLFPGLKFHDTHNVDYIAHPRKPDVTVTPRALHAHTCTALAIVELKSTCVLIDGTAKGQLISAVQRLFALQKASNREIWGFVLNGGDDNAFIFCMRRDGK